MRIPYNSHKKLMIQIGMGVIGGMIALLAFFANIGGLVFLLSAPFLISLGIYFGGKLSHGQGTIYSTFIGGLKGAGIGLILLLISSIVCLFNLEPEPYEPGEVGITENAVLSVLIGFCGYAICTLVGAVLGYKKSSFAPQKNPHERTDSWDA